MKLLQLFLFPVLSLLLVLKQVNAQSASPQQVASIKMNHLALQVKDLAKSADFYQHIIGLDSLADPFKDGRHVWLSLGNSSHLHLIYNSNSPLIIPSKQTHLCFSVASVDEFLAMLRHHKIAWEDLRGSAMQVTTRADGVHQLYLQDPDGYWLEINDARE